MRLRSLFFFGIGLLAAAFIYIAPSSAFEREPGYYTVTHEVGTFVFPDMVVEAKHVALVRHEDVGAPDRTSAVEALGPIYALSLETDGQSLRRYHLRC